MGLGQDEHASRPLRLKLVKGPGDDGQVAISGNLDHALLQVGRISDYGAPEVSDEVHHLVCKRFFL
jgi:hypothetical protein